MNKEALRRYLREKRKQISPARRREAASRAMDHLYATLAPFPTILSFASMESELDLWPLNDLLMRDKRLLLPRMEGDTLIPYRIEAKSALVKSDWGVLEPDPSQCKEEPLSTITCILVPGLGFDANHRRIGYGRGHFDRFLATVPKAQKVGVGFLEQRVEGLLPIEPHDVILDYTALF